MMVLFINACVRKESRTKVLADYLLLKMNDPYEEIYLDSSDFPIVDEDFLCRRDRLIADRDFSDPMFDLAKQFAEADEIIIAAPFWDLSFPAALKQYFEQINVPGITFSYTSEGMPYGLCRAKCLTYLTTVGGDFFPEEYGAGYVKALAQIFYGIPEFRLIKKPRGSILSELMLMPYSILLKMKYEVLMSRVENAIRQTSCRTVTVFDL